MYSPRIMTDGGFLIDRSIALVGPMGTGKSTVGRRLAERLGLPFADSDEEIEKATGLTIAQIFRIRGEPGFRKIERQVIEGLVGEPLQVLATGGGAFLDPVTRSLLLARCRTIWLDSATESLARRISESGRHPLLEGKDVVRELAILAKQRNPLYAEADLTIRSDAGGPEAVVDAIAGALAVAENRA